MSEATRLRSDGSWTPRRRGGIRETTVYALIVGLFNIYNCLPREISLSSLGVGEVKKKMRIVYSVQVMKEAK